jgi:4-hydroxyphenylpyruvate dioxygenase-like putative hemolysin
LNLKSTKKKSSPVHYKILPAYLFSKACTNKKGPKAISRNLLRIALLPPGEPVFLPKQRLFNCLETTQIVKRMKEDFLPINGTDHIEFYVGNAKQTALYYQHCLGFELVAYAGPETGVREKASYVLQQNKIRFVLTTALQPNSPIAAHVSNHGDGVKVLALWVDDARKSFMETVTRGAEPAAEPTVLKDEFGEVVVASIKTYGETIHTFVERKNYKGPFLPGYKPRKSAFQSTPIGLKYIDHCVGTTAWAMSSSAR